MNNQANEAGQLADDRINALSKPTNAPETQEHVAPVKEQVKPNDQQHDWKDRFSKYKANTDSTIHKLRQQASQFDLMQTENETLKKQLETTKAQIPSTPSEMLELFSQEEVDGFTKMVKGEVGGLETEVSRLQAELDVRRKADRDAARQQDHTNVVDAVSRAVPHYQELDKSPGFAKWMREPDSFGNVRYDLLLKAKQSTPPDVGRIVQFYNDYSNELEAAPKQQPTQQQLLQQPSSSATSTPSAPPNLGIAWNTATASQFYKDKALGKINPKEAAALEQDLYRAMGHA